jgi:hypothetical protein
MQRSFKITLPADTNSHNLFSLIVGGTVYGTAQGGTAETAITGAIPTDGTFPDRCQYLAINGDAANTGTVAVNDRNAANTSGIPFAKSLPFSLGPFPTNSICLKDWLMAGSANSQAFEVAIVYT